MKNQRSFQLQEKEDVKTQSKLQKKFQIFFLHAQTLQQWNYQKKTK